MENIFNASEFDRFVYPNQHPLETDNHGRNLHAILSTLMPFLVYAVCKWVFMEACNVNATYQTTIYYT